MMIENTNFSYDEFLISDSYPELASEMELSEYEKDVIRLLVESCTQRIRNRFGLTKILSGKRSPEINKLVGGSKTSDHLTCNANDIYIPEVDMLAVFKWIIRNNLPYRQVIYYPESNTKFIHISVNIPGKPFKNEALVYRNGKYENWG